MWTIPQFLDEAANLQKASMKTTNKKKVKCLNGKENRHPVKRLKGKGKGNRRPVLKPKRK